MGKNKSPTRKDGDRFTPRNEDAAYQILRDHNRRDFDETDADLIPFEDWEATYGWIYPEAGISPPSRIFFEADLEALREVDFPISNVGWPIISNKMLDVLLSVGKFPNRIIPVVMLDDTLDEKKRLNADGTAKLDAANLNFSIIQLLEHLDLFDRDKSDFLADDDDPNEVLDIYKLVLKEEFAGLPPLFRLSVKPAFLFVSAKAQKALEKANIRGIKYNSLNEISIV